MSEWDYEPTPYETLVSNESKHSLLTFMSLVCLLENKKLSPSDIFILTSETEKYECGLEFILNKTSIYDALRTILQYEELRSQKKRDKLIEIIRKYANRHRTEDLQCLSKSTRRASRKTI